MHPTLDDGGGWLLLICDSQVHAPDTPHEGVVGGIDLADLVREMDTAGVDRCVIVPLMAPGSDESTSNQAGLDMAHAQPERFGVMGRFDLTKPENARLLGSWRSSPRMLGVRLAFVREPNVSLLAEDRLDWFWTAAEEAGIPLMIFMPAMLGKVDAIASEHPRLRLIVDHLNLPPRVLYDDLMPVIQPVLDLARYDNVAVKASALPCSVRDSFPFRSLHEPIQRTVEAFGRRRVFWGSDLTRLPCSYTDYVRLFTEELPFLSTEDKDWILGRGLMEWLGWEGGELS